MLATGKLRGRLESDRARSSSLPAVGVALTRSITRNIERLGATVAILFSRSSLTKRLSCGWVRGLSLPVLNPAKNGILKPGWITSGPGTTRILRDAFLALILTTQF